MRYFFLVFVLADFFAAGALAFAVEDLPAAGFLAAALAAGFFSAVGFAIFGRGSVLRYAVAETPVLAAEAAALASAEACFLAASCQFGKNSSIL